MGVSSFYEEFRSGTPGLVCIMAIAVPTADFGSHHALRNSPFAPRSSLQHRRLRRNLFSIIELLRQIHEGTTKGKRSISFLRCNARKCTKTYLYPCIINCPPKPSFGLTESNPTRVIWPPRSWRESHTPLAGQKRQYA